MVQKDFLQMVSWCSVFLSEQICTIRAQFQLALDILRHLQIDIQKEAEQIITAASDQELAPEILLLTAI